MTTFCDVGDVPAEERARVFNMGIGMVLVLTKADADRYVAEHDDASLIGTIE